jgi:hypothetical protein
MADITVCRKNIVLINYVVWALAGLTVLLFLSSYHRDIAFQFVSIKVFGIFYLVGLILILLSARVLYLEIFGRREVRIIEKPVVVREKRKVMKKFTGSSYRKVYHRRSCRFSESIKDKYFEESDDREFFVGKKYKACGLCKPNLRREVVNDDLKAEKKD